MLNDSTYSTVYTSDKDASMTDPYETIRQTLLDEHHGHVGRAFEDACRRLVVEYAHAERLDGELSEWKRGASLAFLRSQGKPNREPKPAPPAVIDPAPDEITGYPV